MYRPARFFPSDQPPANAYVPALRAALTRRAICKKVSVSRSVSQHGVRTANPSEKPSGYRACLRAHQNKRYHIGIRSRVVRSTLSDANEQRDWRICADFAQALIRIARPLERMTIAKDYPQPLRRIKYHDEKSGNAFNFPANNFAIPAQTVADLYRYRWQVKLFFEWIEQHLHIEAFFRHGRECGEDSDRERNLRLCTGRHNQEATQSQQRSLHNVTDFEPHFF